mmetsp:Transcript_1959/g.4303  ORF Transcript_1959/g.4303 Transcript_1959/m.4303 type:complete len:113 (-) Transcript_1959:336-674(-)
MLFGHRKFSALRNKNTNEPSHHRTSRALRSCDAFSKRLFSLSLSLSLSPRSTSKHARVRSIAVVVLRARMNVTSSNKPTEDEAVVVWGLAASRAQSRDRSAGCWRGFCGRIP